MRKSFLAILLTSSVLAWAGDVTVSSPNGQLVVTVSETDGNITYAATLNGQPVITPSALGLKTNIATFTENLSILPPNPPSLKLNAPLGQRPLATNGTQESLKLKVGDRIRVRITITADSDYDFVQVIDRRAACMEPVRQLSGWHDGSSCAPHDCSTNYYFDCLSKGKHVIENVYYIDRTGTYETGTCTVECAYAPEFRAITKSHTLKVKE